MEQVGRNGLVQILWDGRMVWVNDLSGCCIGRFSARGVDVHRSGPEQMETGLECLDCVQDLVPTQAWKRFRTSMEVHHGVRVPASAKPDFVEE
jgi:hypothetical protein